VDRGTPRRIERFFVSRCRGVLPALRGRSRGFAGRRLGRLPCNIGVRDAFTSCESDGGDVPGGVVDC
jgi:hypothetical protein